MSEAKRFNEGKPSLAYILQFVNPMKAIARIMEFGAAKYADGNWRKGGKPDREYLDSMMRHLTYWLHGEVYDDDSGCSHLGHAIWNLLALHELNHPDEIMDDELFKERCAYWAAKKAETETMNDEELSDAAEEIVQAIRAGNISKWEAHVLDSCEYRKMLPKWEEAYKKKSAEMEDNNAKVVKETFDALPTAKPRQAAGPRVWPYDNEYQTLAAMGNNSESPTIEKMGEVLKAGLVEAAGPGELRIPAEHCDDSPPLQENVTLAEIESAAWQKMLRDAPHPVYCACDVCMDLPPRQVVLKNTWGLPAIEVFNEAGEKRAAEICGVKLADVSEEVKVENLLKGAPITVNFISSETREKGESLQGYQTLGVMSSVNTFDVLAALPPMDEDELVDALYTNEDMNSRAKQELSLVKSRRVALAESEAEITFSIRDLQQCESFLELKRKYILPALHKQARVFDLEWNRAHGEYFRQLTDEHYEAVRAEEAAEKETE
jgi:hypothetical protein